MAKYWIDYACGHEGRVKLFGKEKDRDKKREWLTTQLCPDCRKVAEKEALEKKWEEIGGNNIVLPPLKGSKKQVAWAETIRKTQLIALDAYTEEHAKKAPTQYIDVAKELNSVICGFFRAQTSASWWIDNREKNAYSLIKDNWDTLGTMQKEVFDKWGITPSKRS